MYPATVADWRALAQRRLPRFLFDYVAGGAGDEATLAANVADFAAIRLRQHVLVDVSHVDTRSQLAGQACAMPLALAPVGLAGMLARRGEAQAARGAGRRRAVHAVDRRYLPVGRGRGRHRASALVPALHAARPWRRSRPA